METTTLAAPDSKAAYLATREAWKVLARNKANSAHDYIRYIITQAMNLTEKLGSEQAEAWALRKIRAAFSPSVKPGRRTLDQRLYMVKVIGKPFAAAWPYPMVATDPTDEEVKAFRAFATNLHDTIRMEG